MIAFSKELGSWKITTLQSENFYETVKIFVTHVFNGPIYISMIPSKDQRGQRTVEIIELK